MSEIGPSATPCSACWLAMPVLAWMLVEQRGLAPCGDQPRDWLTLILGACSGPAISSPGTGAQTHPHRQASLLTMTGRSSSRSLLAAVQRTGQSGFLSAIIALAGAAPLVVPAGAQRGPLLGDAIASPPPASSPPICWPSSSCARAADRHDHGLTCLQPSRLFAAAWLSGEPLAGIHPARLADRAALALWAQPSVRPSSRSPCRGCPRPSHRSRCWCNRSSPSRSLDDPG